MSVGPSTRRLPQSPSSPQQNGRRMSLADVSRKGNLMPNRYLIHAVEKFGKTSLGAHFPKPIFIESRGETGLETLLDSGRLPETAHFPECQTWTELLSAVESLITDEHDFRTLVIDTINGAEKLMHEEVCRREYNGDFGERGFTGYMRGFEVACTDLRQFLAKLDVLREKRRMTIVMLAHTRIKTFSNPLGANYDRYQIDCHEKTFGLLNRWADVILFGNFETYVNENNEKKKGKAVSQCRMLYTDKSAAWDAGNRLGLPAEIPMGETPDEAWANFAAAVKAARAAGNGNGTPPAAPVSAPVNLGADNTDLLPTT